MANSTFCTPSEHGYSLQFSPFYGNELALVTSQNYGINGRGKLYYLEILPNGTLNPLLVSEWPSDGLFDVAWSENDANVCITASGDGSIQMWDRSVNNLGQPIKVWKEHVKEVSSVEWSINRSQSPQFISASWDGSIKIWDPKSANSLCTLRGHENIAYCASWAVHIPNTIASASGDHTVRIWDLNTPDKAALVIPAHQGEVLHCDWNKYSQNVLASAGTDRLIRGWDIRNPNQRLFELSGHQYAVRRVKFSPHKDSVLASVSYDFSTRLWDTSSLTSTSLQVLTHHTEFVYGLDFNLHIPGQFADCSFDQTLKVYTTP